MLRASRQVKLGPSQVVISAIGSYYPAGIGCEVTANCLYLAMAKDPLDLPRSSIPSAQWPFAFFGVQIRTHHRPTVKRGEFMELLVRSLVISSAVIGLLFLFSPPSAVAGDQHGFSLKVFTSPDDQFWNNSVIIEGAHEVMLVDAQLTKTSAEKVLQEIRETKKPLSIIYITHEHADHFLGLEVFREAYPRVRIIATESRMSIKRK
jgi:hypothetical protein